jgi:TPR repeat protein
MNRTFITLLSVSVLNGCAEGPPAPGSQGRALPPPWEAVALSPSVTSEESRTPASLEALWPQDEDGLSLKPTELSPDLGIGDEVFRIDQQSAIGGDRDAAVRVARMFQRGTNNVPRDEKRMVQWLRRASDLKHGSASYELYLYYIERELDREAVRYEKRALDQGFTPPPRLDPRRG